MAKGDTTPAGKVRPRWRFWRLALVALVLFAVAATAETLVNGGFSLWGVVAASTSGVAGTLFSISLVDMWYADKSRREAEAREEAIRRETEVMLRDTVAGTIGQDPEYLQKYFNQEAIGKFLEGNLQAKTGDREFATAVSRDLLGSILEKKRPTSRSNWIYSVCMHHEPLTGLATCDERYFWRVDEQLSFDERRPDWLKEGNVLAAMVFCEKALSPWFQTQGCIYRTVAHLPSSLRGPEAAAARRDWALDHLTCSIEIDGETLSLTPQVLMDGDDRESWAVTFTLAQEPPALSSSQVRSVVLTSRATLPEARRNYTAYLAYPTPKPTVNFEINGPVRDVEYAAFYNAASNPDVVDKRDEQPGRTKLSIYLAEVRWVFPDSGVVFSWVMDETS